MNLVDNEILEDEAMEYVSKEEISGAVKIKHMELHFETGETREETRTKERKKEKNCELGVFCGTSDFNIFIDGT